MLSMQSVLPTQLVCSLPWLSIPCYTCSVLYMAISSLLCPSSLLSVLYAYLVSLTNIRLILGNKTYSIKIVSQKLVVLSLNFKKSQTIANFNNFVRLKKLSKGITGRERGMELKVLGIKIGCIMYLLAYTCAFCMPVTTMNSNYNLTH